MEEAQHRSEGLPGQVVGRWAEDQVLLRLDDGRTFEVSAPDEVSGFDVGDRVTVYFDAIGRPIGWYLTDKGQGVDLRGWGGAREHGAPEVP